MKVEDTNAEVTDHLSEDYQIPNDIILMTFDEALTKVGGGANRYQIMCFIYFGLQWMLANWVLMAPVYLFVNPYVDCGGDANCLQSCRQRDSFSDQSCQDYICELPTSNRMNHLSGDSLLMYFDPPLICGAKNTASLLQSLVYGGSLLGFFFFSFIADNYGRKPGLGMAWFVATIGAFTLGLAINVEMVGLGIFLCGFGINPAITIHYSYINEHSQGKFREYQNAGVQVFFGFGEIILVGIAYTFPEWRVLALYWIAIPILILNIPMYFIEESPKYMYAKNKVLAVEILNKIAKINGKPPVLSIQIKNCKHNQVNSNRVFSIVDLLTYPSLRTKFLCGVIIFMSMQLVFYGINFAMQRIGLNLYINALVIALFETLSYCVCDFLIPLLKRKKTIFLGFFGSCLICCLYELVQKPDDCGEACAIIIIQVLLIGVIRFSVTTVWTFAYIHLSELFPTVVRSLALGLISAGGTVGSMSSPFVGDFSLYIGLKPLLALGIVGGVGSLFVLPLKETFKMELEDEIEEDVEANRTTYRLSQDIAMIYKSA